MTTGKQRDANRRNAQQSTGPQTSEGKRIASQNAVTHELTATSRVIFAEKQDEFNAFAQRIRNHYQPEEAAEDLAVERIIDCGWRLQRAAQIEAGIFAANVPRELAVASGNENGLKPLEASNAALGKAYSRNAGAFSQLSRHERQIECSYYMAIQQLERLQYARNMGCDPFYAGNMGKFTMSNSYRKKRKAPTVREPGRLENGRAGTRYCEPD